jgi:hypothetical protein
MHPRMAHPRSKSSFALLCLEALFTCLVELRPELASLLDRALALAQAQVHVDKIVSIVKR